MWGYLKRNRKLFTYNMLSTSTTITRHPAESSEKAQNLNNFHILLRLFHFFLHRSCNFISTVVSSAQIR